MVLTTPVSAIIRMPARRRRRLVVAWLLTLGFAFQPFLAYLVTPMVGHDAHGQMVVEQCTLMGSKRLSGVLLPEPTRAAQHSHSGHDAHAAAAESSGHGAHEHHASGGHEHHGSAGLAPDLSTEPAKDLANSEHCPALTLFKLAGSVQILLPPAIVTLTPDTVVRFTPVADHFHRTVEFSDYQTRAPPAFS